MADDLLTVSDFIADALDLAEIEVSDLLNMSPFFARLPIVGSSNGTTHKYAKEIGAPVVGFRAENAGRDLDHSADQLVTVNLKILDFSWAVDKAVADAWRRGGAAAKVAREGRRHLRQAMYMAEAQYVNGTGNSADGFAGFADAILLDDVDDPQVIDAGGSSARTSIYLVREGEDAVCGVVNEDDGGIMLGDTIVQDFTDGTGKHFPAYYTPGCTWIALQIGGRYDVVRIANIDASTHKATDDLIYQALELFPEGKQPTVILMNRRSKFQIRDARTATNNTGAPAPVPTEVEGIPIVTVESISNAEGDIGSSGA